YCLQNGRAILILNCESACLKVGQSYIPFTMMQRIRRPFYIIGHNPNTLEEAGEYLQLGANALEPDIIIKDNQFYVSHSHPLFYKDVLTLDAYLEGLKKLISEHDYNLALVIFDMKDTDFD